jgi:putative membrane protein
MANPDLKFDTNTELAARRTGISFQRTRMSADRTLMSVICTSLSLIGFGFTTFQFWRDCFRVGDVPRSAKRRAQHVLLAQDRRSCCSRESP